MQTARSGVLVENQSLPFPHCPFSPPELALETPLYNPSDSCTSWKAITCSGGFGPNGLISKKRNGDIPLSWLVPTSFK